MTASCQKKGIYIECISSSNASVTGDCLSGYISPRAMYLAFILVTNDFSTSVLMATSQETKVSALTHHPLPLLSHPTASSQLESSLYTSRMYTYASWPHRFHSLSLGTDKQLPLESSNFTVN